MSDLTPREETTRRLVAVIRHHLGADLCQTIEDPQVIEVMLNDDGQLWEDRLGAGMTQIGTMKPEAAGSFVATVAATLGEIVDHRNPILECEMPIRGARFEATVPPLSQAPGFACRLKATSLFTLDDYVADGIITPRQCAILRDSIARKRNVLVVGGTTSGKTTLVNALLKEVAEITPRDRVVIMEDVWELQSPTANKLSLKTRAKIGVDMTLLLKTAMRFRPDRIIVGEVRDGAALALLKAMNTGHDGCMSTLHASSAKRGLIRLEQLIAEASLSPMRDVIAETINLVVSIQRVGVTGRRVREIIQVEGLHDGEFVTTPLE